MKFMRKYFFPLLTILLLSTSSLIFAAGNEPPATAGYADHVLLFYPKSPTLDPAKAIELSTNKALYTMGNTPLEFSADSTDNLSIFRIYDTLPNDYQYIPQYRESYYSYDDGFFSFGNSVTLSIHTSGIFVNLDDPGTTRDFSLNCILNEARIKSDASSFELIKSNQDMANGTKYYTISDFDVYSQFTDFGNGDYELFVPSTPTVSIGQTSQSADGGYYFPLFLRLFDVCIKLEQPKDPSKEIKAGYYSTTITIESTSTYQNLIWRGTKGVLGKNKIDNDVYTMTMSQTVTVYGYVAGDTITQPTFHILSISPSTDTYSINLADKDTLYSVAQIEFHANSEVLSSEDPETANIIKTSPNVRKSYYKVYITPNSKYTGPSSDYGEYSFKKNINDAVAKQITYDLYLKTGSGGGTDTAFKNITQSTEMPSSSTIGYAEGSSSSKVYTIVPDYTLYKEKYSNNPQHVKYSEFWDLSDVTIYLKVTGDTTGKAIGQYTSTIFFTLVTN